MSSSERRWEAGGLAAFIEGGGEMNKRKHEILCNMYPIYSGYSTQEAIRAWESGIEEQLDLEWYINGNLYRTSGKPSTVAV